MKSPKLHLMRITNSGELELVGDPPRPSFPCPQVIVSSFSVARMQVGEDGEILCDLEIEGTVRSPLCDRLNDEFGMISSVLLFVNHNENAFGEYDVEVSKSEAQEAVSNRPFPYEGRFTFEATRIPVTEGNNVFEIKAEDPTTKIYGNSSWAVSFLAEFVESPNGEFRLKDEGISSEKPIPIGGGQVPETYFYSFAVSDLEGFEPGQVKLIVGNEDALQLPLVPISGMDTWWVAVRSKALSSTPFQFFLTQPLIESPGFVPTDHQFAEGLAKMLGETWDSGSRFVAAFSAGFFMGSVCVHGGGDAKTGNAADSELERPFPRVNAHLSADGTPLGDVDLYLSPLKGEATLARYGISTIPELLASIDSSIRKNPDLAIDATIAMISGGGYEDIGIHDVEISDWREEFLSVMAEITTDILESKTLNSEVARGYYIGRAYGDAYRATLDPGRGVRHELGRGDFLSALPRLTHFYRNGNAGAKILENNRDLIERLTGQPLKTRVE